MSTPGIGYQGIVQIGREATYGTEVNATRRLEVISMRVKPGIAHIRDTSLPGTRSIKNRARTRPAQEFSIKLRFDYTGMLLLIDAIMGTSTFGSVGGVTTGANPYAHVWTMLPLFNSHTLEFQEGSPSATSAITNLLGAKFNTMKLSGKRGNGEDSMLIMELTGFAQTLDEAATITGALSAPSYNPVLFREMVAAPDVGHGDSAADVRLRAFSLTIDNKLDATREYGGSAGLIDEPIVNGFADVKWSFTNEYKTQTALAMAMAMTSGSPKLIFGSTTSKRVTLESGNAFITDYGHPVEGPGIIEQTFEYEADYSSGDASALKITVEDTASSIT